MDGMEFNKAFSAVLVAGIAFLALGIVSDNVVHPERLKESVLKIKGAEEGAAPAAAPAGPPDIAPLLASAVVPDGEAFTKKVCIACHNFDQGGPNKVGPNLYGVVGRERASAPGFTYSAALKGKPGKWTFGDLNKWLISPASFAPGTKMAYAGISNDQMRADVIDYLHTLSPSPEALPKPEAAPPAAAAAAAPAAAGDALPPLAPLLASSNPEDGHAFTKTICVACHNFQKGEGNKVGPLLYGVVGRERASAPGFEYSAALKGKTGKWTFDSLNEWLAKPAAYAPGTKMAYAGIHDPQKRADVINYLHTLSDSPEALPSAGAPAAPAPASPQATPNDSAPKPN